jgi:hypothetical protein
MFSGVFQPDVDLPFLNSVTVDLNGYTVNNTFQQHYNHYHCPVLPLYSENDNVMHTVFFGGIAQFYDNDGLLVQDDNVPFVNTIARVSRDTDGNMEESKLPIVMPELLGSGAEFIPNLSFPKYNNGVFKFDDLTLDYTLIGYIFGGINSTQSNIFFINNGTQSVASNQIFKVFIKKSSSLSVDELIHNTTNNANLVIYPNPNDGILNISFNMSNSGNATLSIFDIKGSLIDEIELKNLNKGKNTYKKTLDSYKNNQVYFITFETKTQKATQKLILEK